MPKFRKAVFICFDGSASPIGRFRHMNNSYFQDQRDDEYSMTKTITVSTERKRKSLFYDTLPFVGINFPYTEFSERLDPESLNIHHFQTNKQIADEMLKEKLENIEPYSRIYINAHGSDSNYILNYVCINKDEDYYYEFEIKADLVADFLDKYIPVYAKNNLQIFLLVCKAMKFSEILMEELHYRRFRNTSVVCYKRNMVATLMPIYIDNNTISMNDYASVPKIDHLYRGRRNPNSNGSNPDKLVYHNYGGQLEQIDYPQFKERYFRNIDYSISDINTDFDSYIEEIFSFQNTLLHAIGDYLNRYERRGNSGFLHRHNRSGYDRAIELFKNINNVSGKDILDNKNQCLRDIIIQLVNLVNKDSDYSSYYGNINVNDYSLLTYILAAVDMFYRRDEIPKNIIFQEFYHYLTARYLSREGSSIYIRSNNKRSREILRERLQDLTPDIIDIWFESSQEYEADHQIFPLYRRSYSGSFDDMDEKGGSF